MKFKFDNNAIIVFNNSNLGEMIGKPKLFFDFEECNLEKITTNIKYSSIISNNLMIELNLKYFSLELENMIKQAIQLDKTGTLTIKNSSGNFSIPQVYWHNIMEIVNGKEQQKLIFQMPSHHNFIYSIYPSNFQISKNQGE